MNSNDVVPLAIKRALRLIAAHPSIQALQQTAVPSVNGTIEVEVSLRVSMPNAWMAEGRSPNGVHTVETVTMSFPRSFPIDPPTFRLRPDFNRSLAHIQPGPLAEAPVPCIYDGDPRELLQSQGLAGILNQLVVWLERAASGRLIDPEHGWEPVRRDNLTDWVIVDSDFLRTRAKSREDHVLLPFYYRRSILPDGLAVVFGRLGTTAVPSSLADPSQLFAERSLSPDESIWAGCSLAIVAWPAAQPTKVPPSLLRYQPETVADVASLMERAEGYGCAGSLRAGIDRVKHLFLRAKGAGTLPLVVVLIARRPYNLIHSDSNLEICPYLTWITTRQLFSQGDRTEVRPIGLRHEITVPLLRRMSTDQVDLRPPSWVLVGAGSLGSKIGLHLARAGHAPAVVIDKDILNPHNAARHALTPPADGLQLAWCVPKAAALTCAISGLGQSADGRHEDIVGILQNDRGAMTALGKGTSLIVNATASLAVREAFAAVDPSAPFPRVVETSLFADGRVALVTFEGPNRNPNCGDLIAFAYEKMRQEPRLRRIFFPKDEGIRRQEIGEGCGTATAVLSDARISMFAAPSSEFILEELRREHPKTGRLLLGLLTEDNMSLAWTAHALEPCQVVDVEGSQDWKLRISAHAHQAICADVARWVGCETGGILMGRMSEAARTFYITDVLAAPEDSRRSAGMFVLGVHGVRARISAYAQACNSSLYCLGTWHSHLVASGPSDLDKVVANKVGRSRLSPSVLLIHTPGGYRALMAESK